MTDFSKFLLMYYGPIALIALGIAVWINTKWGEQWLDGEEEEPQSPV